MFKDSLGLDFKKVTDFSEYEILGFLLSKGDFKEIIFEELGLPKSNVKVLQQVKHPLILNPNVKPDDLDVVLYRKDAIKKAIAIETKYIMTKCYPITYSPTLMVKVPNSTKI